MLRGSKLCLWIGALVFGSGAFCQTYTAIDVFGPWCGGYSTETHPTSINKQGDIAGYYGTH